MSNSDEMLKASMGALDRVKTIDELTKKVTATKQEIGLQGEKIREYGGGLLKNMTSKKVKTNIMIANRWGDQNCVFANYGIGVQTKYNQNATSLTALGWDEFVKICLSLKDNSLSFPTYLKPEKVAILKRFLKNIEKLRINRESQSIQMEKEIKYMDRYMVRDDERRAELKNVEYYNNQLSFNNTAGNMVKVNIDNPRLEDALILEQIFDETKELLEKEIIRLENELDNYNFFISELKQDFSNELLIMEFAK